jgi:LmbE family N-acetylglucosaminyl deacetylase
MFKKILVVCAHPDDEVIGCGGTIAKLAKNSEINLLTFTDGESSRLKKSIKERIINRKKMLHKASKILGIKNLHQHNFDDNQLDNYSNLELTKLVEKYILKYNPDTIFTHYKNDLNIDHRKVFEAVITATRPFKNKSLKNVFSFEITSSTELSLYSEKFNPNFFINIENGIKKKKQALNIYKSQLNKEKGLLTIENIIILSKYRGNFIGCKHAEAFEVIRMSI